MIPQLHNYQKDGHDFGISHLVFGLLFPPGLGKTLTTLSIIKTLKDAGDTDRFLVVAPMRVMYMVWPAEVKKWGFNYSVGILHGPDKDSVIRKKHDIYVINPEGLQWLYNNHLQLFTKFRFMLICDESTLFKNHDSMRFKVLKKMLSLFRRRCILTGTPVPNGLLQLWSQMYILDYGKRLGKNITTYRNRWFLPNYNGFGYALREGVEDEVFNAVDDIVIHKSLDELDMPELLFNDIKVKLSGNAMKMYKDMKHELVAEYEDGSEVVTAFSASAKALKLKQIANGAVYNEDRFVVEVHSEKIKALRELVDSLSGRPLLVAYEFLHDLDKIKVEFNCPNIGGGMAQGETDLLAFRWNKGLIPVLAVHPKAVGHGLNLQDGGCNDIVWFSMTFDLELYEQLNARVYRQGVKNNVTIHHIIADDTVDCKVAEAILMKSSLQDALLESLLK